MITEKREVRGTHMREESKMSFMFEQKNAVISLMLHTFHLSTKFLSLYYKQNSMQIIIRDVLLKPHHPRIYHLVVPAQGRREASGTSLKGHLS
jgi:hypothetical protein